MAAWRPSGKNSALRNQAGLNLLQKLRGRETAPASTLEPSTPEIQNQLFPRNWPQPRAATPVIRAQRTFRPKRSSDAVSFS
jgi:hypothetical protein